LLKILQPIYQIERSFVVIGAKYCHLPFDFGIQVKKSNHRVGWKAAQANIQLASPNETFKRDLFKQTCANKNGFSTIQDSQEDVWKDK
jgi:hypothetical protein